MQQGKKTLRFLVALCLVTLNFQLNTYVPPTWSLLTGDTTARQSPCARPVSGGISLTCELHSAVILKPLPWSHHHANHKASEASARFSPVLLFSQPPTLWNAEKPELNPSSARLSIQLLGSSWTIAALRSLAFPFGVWAATPSCLQTAT